MRYWIHNITDNGDFEIVGSNSFEDMVRLAIRYRIMDEGYYYVYDDEDRKMYTLDEGIKEVFRRGGKMYDIN